MAFTTFAAITEAGARRRFARLWSARTPSSIDADELPGRRPTSCSKAYPERRRRCSRRRVRAGLTLQFGRIQFIRPMPGDVPGNEPVHFQTTASS